MAPKRERITAGIIGVFGLAVAGSLVWLSRTSARDDETGGVFLGIAAIALSITVLLVGSIVVHSARQGAFPTLRRWWPRFYVPASSPVQLVFWLLTALVIGFLKGCGRLD